MIKHSSRAPELEFYHQMQFSVIYFKDPATLG